jgi:hypothetical protein
VRRNDVEDEVIARVQVDEARAKRADAMAGVGTTALPLAIYSVVRTMSPYAGYYASDPGATEWRGE